MQHKHVVCSHLIKYVKSSIFQHPCAPSKEEKTKTWIKKSQETQNDMQTANMAHVLHTVEVFFPFYFGLQEHYKKKKKCGTVTLLPPQ